MEESQLAVIAFGTISALWLLYISRMRGSETQRCLEVPMMEEFETNEVMNVVELDIKTSEAIVKHRERKKANSIRSMEKEEMPMKGSQCHVRGLRNRGNTCFMNAVLQALANIPQFLAYLEDLEIMSRNNEFILAFLECMQALSPTSKTMPSYNPHRLHQLVSAKASQFYGNDQQDAEELLQLIIQILEEESKLTRKMSTPPGSFILNDPPSPSETPISSATSVLDRKKLPLSGWYISSLKCSICSKIRPLRNIPFIDISLPLPEALYHYGVSGSRLPGGSSSTTSVASLFNFSCSLNDCLDSFTTEEVVDGVECTGCSFSRKFSSLKEELQGLHLTSSMLGDSFNEELIHEIDLRESLRSQLATAISRDINDDDGSLPEVPSVKSSFVKRLQISRTPPVLCIHFGRKIYSLCENRLVKLHQKVRFPMILDLSQYCLFEFSSGVKECVYRLNAVIVHRGSATNGHYTTFRRLPCDRWVNVSDEKTEIVDSEQVMNSEAYMLFYVQNS